MQLCCLDPKTQLLTLDNSFSLIVKRKKMAQAKQSANKLWLMWNRRSTIVMMDCRGISVSVRTRACYINQNSDPCLSVPVKALADGPWFLLTLFKYLSNLSQTERFPLWQEMGNTAENAKFSWGWLYRSSFGWMAILIVNGKIVV